MSALSLRRCIAMRAELHAILWVSAIFVLGWGLLNGSQNAPILGLGTLDEGLSTTSSVVELGSDIAAGLGSSKRSVIASAVPSDRLLFPAGLSSSAVASAEPSAIDPWDDLVLRGIIQNGDDIQAVLATKTEPSSYFVAKIGGAVLDGVVIDIGPDHATLRSADGRVHDYPLRGAGEAG